MKKMLIATCVLSMALAGVTYAADTYTGKYVTDKVNKLDKQEQALRAKNDAAQANAKARKQAAKNKQEAQKKKAEKLKNAHKAKKEAAKKSYENEKNEWKNILK